MASVVARCFVYALFGVALIALGHYADIRTHFSGSDDPEAGLAATWAGCGLIVSFVVSAWTINTLVDERDKYKRDLEKEEQDRKHRAMWR